MKALASLLCVLTAWAATDDDPIEVLLRVREKVLAHAQRIPNHTCVETVTRDAYVYLEVPAPKSCDGLLGRRHQAGVGTLIRLATTDRLRLDVGLAELAEMYSWPGAKRFESRDIDDFVPPGAIGTGPFASALLSVFEIRDPSFVFEKAEVIEGRRLMEYSFAVPAEQSHYKAKAGDQWLITGYTGTMLVDPVTADLVQMTVRTEELPAATNLCEVDSTLDYATMRVRGEDYIVPGFSRQRFIGQDGSEAENAITFSACRDFRGESAVSFGEGNEAAAGTPPAGPSPLVLPAHLPVWIEMTSTIELDQAAAGDRIEGRLAQPIRNLPKILVPAGARVEGRVVRAGTVYGPRNQATLGLRWETVEVNGVQIPFFIAPERKVANPEDPKKQDPFEAGRIGEQRYAAYHFLGDHIVVKGLPASRWLTFEP